MVKPLLFAALLVSLFVIFAPFELNQEGSRLPQYLAALLPLAILGTLDHRTALTSLIRPPAALLVAVAVLIHAAVVDPVSPLFFIGLTGAFMSLTVITRLSVLRPEIFAQAMRLLSWFTIGSFVLQWFLYVATSEMVDLHNMIFPTSTARVSENYLGVTRLSGWHVEPGTYAVSLGLMLMTLRLILHRFDFLTYAGIVTMIGSFSTEGIVISSGLMTWIVLDRAVPPRNGITNHRNPTTDIGKATLAIVLILGIAAAIGIPDYLGNRFGDGRYDGSQVYKEVALSAVVSRTLSEQIQGLGFDSAVCDCSMDGLGFGLNLVARGGILTTFALIVFIIAILHRGVSARSLLMVLAILAIARFSVTIPLAWIPLFLIAEHASFRPNNLVSPRIERMISLPHDEIKRV